MLILICSELPKMELLKKCKCFQNEKIRQVRRKYSEINIEIIVIDIGQIVTNFVTGSILVYTEVTLVIMK